MTPEQALDYIHREIIEASNAGLVINKRSPVLMNAFQILHYRLARPHRDWAKIQLQRDKLRDMLQEGCKYVRTAEPDWKLSSIKLLRAFADKAEKLLDEISTNAESCFTCEYFCSTPDPKICLPGDPSGEKCRNYKKK